MTNTHDVERLAGKTLAEWQMYARQDDCLDLMVPSDLRVLVGHILTISAQLAEARAALDAAREGVRVKPLEWKGDALSSRAMSAVGEYRVMKTANKRNFRYVVVFIDAERKSHTLGYVEGEVAAKAAAQAHHDARIRSYLEPAPTYEEWRQAGHREAAAAAFERLNPTNDRRDWTPYAHDMHYAAKEARLAILALSEAPAPDPVGEAFHDEQVRIWSEEIIGALALADVLKVEAYDDKVSAYRAVEEELKAIGRALAGEDG